MTDDPSLSGFFSSYEVKITRVHVHPDLIFDTHPNRIDPNKWSPLIQNFQKFYGLTEEVHPSRLAEIDEDIYRTLAQVD